MLRQFSKFRTSQAGSRRKLSTSLAAAHSSWFKIADQGMKDYELLARGSGFYVRGPATGSLLAVVSAHVAAPHRFPRYFSQEWLQHVRDTDCQTILETRSTDGKLVTGLVATQELTSGYRHASLDVAAFVLNDADIPADAKLEILQLTNDDDASRLGLEVVVAGHRLIGNSGSGTEAVVSAETPGTVSKSSGSRAFVDTGDVETEMGMCGGPIVIAAERDVCVGVLEGLVPRLQDGEKAESDLHKQVSGHSVLITARELRMFLHDVETEHARKVKEQAG